MSEQRSRHQRSMLFFVGTLCEVIKTTVIKWGRLTHIVDPNLIREMFKLIYNQYDGIGEVDSFDDRRRCSIIEQTPRLDLTLSRSNLHHQ